MTDKKKLKLPETKPKRSKAIIENNRIEKSIKSKSSAKENPGDDNMIRDNVAGYFGERKRDNAKFNRMELMWKAKYLHIKNYRVLNRDELVRAIDAAEDGEQTVLEAIIKGAVDRWKSGWGKRGKRDAWTKKTV